METKLITNLINSIKHRTEEINNDIEFLQSLISRSQYGNFNERVKYEIQMSVEDFIFVGTVVSRIIKTMDQDVNIQKELVNEIKNSKIAKRVNRYLTLEDYLFIFLLISNALAKIKLQGDVPQEFVNRINDPLDTEAMEMHLYYNYKIENKHQIILSRQLTLKEREDILNLRKESYHALTADNIYSVKVLLERILDKK